MTDQPAAVRRLAAPPGYQLAGSVGALAFSPYDPCARLADGGFWWATRTPDGPGTLSLRLVPAAGARGSGGAGSARPAGAELVAAAYGPGAGWLAGQADAVAGLRDDLGDFTARAAAHPVVAGLARRHRGRRMPATGRLFPALLRAVLEQKVTGAEAYRGYAAIVRHFRAPAPGPQPGLLLPPAAADVAATPYWVFHRLGVEQRRAQALCRAAAVADRLERCADAAGATARLTALPGIGPWTAAEVVRTVFGDPDAVSVGDYHLPNLVAWALAGQPRADDARMLELLAPFAGHRGRVCLLLAAGGRHAPRYGPRAPVRSFATY